MSESEGYIILELRRLHGAGDNPPSYDQLLRLMDTLQRIPGITHILSAWFLRSITVYDGTHRNLETNSVTRYKRHLDARNYSYEIPIKYKGEYETISDEILARIFYSSIAEEFMYSVSPSSHPIIRT